MSVNNARVLVLCAFRRKEHAQFSMKLFSLFYLHNRVLIYYNVAGTTVLADFAPACAYSCTPDLPLSLLIWTLVIAVRDMEGGKFRRGKVRSSQGNGWPDFNIKNFFVLDVYEKVIGYPELSFAFCKYNCQWR